MNKIHCYINDNYIQIYKENKIYDIKLDSILLGNIVDKKLFIKEIKKYKIFNSIFTYEIYIYLNKNILEKDILYYNYIFEDLNCNKINVLSTKSYIYSPTLIYEDDYYIIYYNENYYFIIKDLLTIFLKLYNINKLMVISPIKLKENKNCKYYYYNNYKTYFFDKILG